jgi:hypothetical protein
MSADAHPLIAVFFLVRRICRELQASEAPAARLDRHGGPPRAVRFLREARRWRRRGPATAGTTRREGAPAQERVAAHARRRARAFHDHPCAEREAGLVEAANDRAERDRRHGEEEQPARAAEVRLERAELVAWGDVTRDADDPLRVGHHRRLT